MWSLDLRIYFHGAVLCPGSCLLFEFASFCLWSNDLINFSKPFQLICLAFDSLFMALLYLWGLCTVLLLLLFLFSNSFVANLCWRLRELWKVGWIPKLHCVTWIWILLLFLHKLKIEKLFYFKSYISQFFFQRA